METSTEFTNENENENPEGPFMLPSPATMEIDFPIFELSRPSCPIWVQKRMPYGFVAIKVGTQGAEVKNLTAVRRVLDKVAFFRFDNIERIPGAFVITYKVTESVTLSEMEDKLFVLPTMDPEKLLRMFRISGSFLGPKIEGKERAFFCSADEAFPENAHRH